MVLVDLGVVLYSQTACFGLARRPYTRSLELIRA